MGILVDFTNVNQNRLNRQYSNKWIQYKNHRRASTISYYQTFMGNKACMFLDCCSKPVEFHADTGRTC